MKVKFLVILLLLVGTKLFGQGIINNYKFIIVPSQYSFQSEADQYRINTLIRHLFKQRGYAVYMDTENYPKELNLNNCKALKAELESSGAFNTKSVIKLLDCKGNLVFVSEEGFSKEKEYKKAYQESIRSAFESVGNFNYIAPDNAAFYGGDAVDFTESDDVDTAVIDFKANTAAIDQFYAYNDAIYVLSKNDNDSFDIIKKNFEAVKKELENEKVGQLVPSSRDNSYLLTMGAVQAAAYFDTEGNLVFDKIDGSGKVNTATFKKIKK
jgi:hypothetical protein